MNNELHLITVAVVTLLVGSLGVGLVGHYMKGNLKDQYNECYSETHDSHYCEIQVYR